ncbi:DUF3303 domain-containing protein [Methanolobus vulcani]|uniref:DUF3303 domain-containing protein n=1 Tax=Methanolobus vulcani TaxID=38026 RepID=A0A7Z8KSS3_9EURY|nr:DUF3303 family protein [Methanolobus vulcani]TQD28450.1 DUF3303 domain-containing protein [Methanolobus vulcani]
MRFMDICTWDIKDNQEVHSRYETWEYPKGYNVISEWFDISSCRVFIVYELENAEAYARSAFPFRDIMKLETIPIMTPQEAIEIGEKMEEEMSKA